MKKIICTILIFCFIFSSAVISTYGLDSIDTNVPNVAIDMQINKLLSYYYDSLVGDQPEPYSNICIENDNTLFFKKFVEFDSIAKNLINCKITSYHFDYEYVDFVENETNANVAIEADFYFTYEGRKSESSMSNIAYIFTFAKTDNKWYITSVDTDFDGFVRVKKISNNDSTLSSDELFATEIQLIEENLAYEEYINQAYELGDFIPVEVEENTDAMMPLAATSYAYNATRAANWASAHAEDEDNSSYFNYIENGDGGNCQNFVSQCVWVGYGGNIAGAGNTISNIRNRIRMVSGSDGLYTSPKGSSDTSETWTHVNPFWDYVTSSPTVGPKGTGYNDDDLYTYISAFSISKGCVLQFREGRRILNGGNYQHSVIVSDVQTSGMMSTSYDKIFVCANSHTRKDVPLKSVMIDGFGGSNCYMRMIVFQAGNFNS